MEAVKAPYLAVTRQIEVKVIPRFLAERSSPENGYFFWAYTITLTNLGAETVQLKTRHWRITDALGRLQEVRGAGVVGEEPVLKPGREFRVYQWCASADVLRIHDRHLRNDQCSGGEIRDPDSGVLARHA